jgi:hypothetical protein
MRIGDNAASLAAFGDESVKPETYKSYVMRKWVLANGNELSVTLSGAGRIVYLESDWDGGDVDTGCDLPGLKFGATTLHELRDRFGSNGFEFEKRGPGVDVAGGFVMFNSFEIGSKVVTFFTKVSREDFERLKKAGSSSEIAQFAKLDAISIADASYAKDEWGARIYDPNYKSVGWK